MDTRTDGVLTVGVRDVTPLPRPAGWSDTYQGGWSGRSARDVCRCLGGGLESRGERTRDEGDRVLPRSPTNYR